MSKICQHWSAGKCNRGAACRFQHVGAGGTAGEAPVATYADSDLRDEQELMRLLSGGGGALKEAVEYDAINTWDRVLTRTWEDPAPAGARPAKLGEMKKQMVELRKKHRAAALPMGAGMRDLELLAYRARLE